MPEYRKPTLGAGGTVHLSGMPEYRKPTLGAGGAVHLSGMPEYRKPTSRTGDEAAGSPWLLLLTRMTTVPVAKFKRVA